MEETVAEMGNEKKSLQECLQAAIDNFCVGEDEEGMKSFLIFLEKLEYVVEDDWKKPQPQIDLDQLLPVLRKLRFSMKNQDITGMTDLLEGMTAPPVQKMLKGCDEA